MSVRDLKYLRMNKIRAALETGDRSYKELFALVYGADLDPSGSAERALHFDLKGLRTLGLVTLEGGRYYSSEIKTVYRNTSEYKVALKHSRHITYGFDRMEPELIVNILVPDPLNPYRGPTKGKALITEQTRDRVAQLLSVKKVRGKYFTSHLKTGYYTDVYQPLLRYREIGEKYPKIKQTLKIRDVEWDGWDDDEVVEVDLDDAVFMGPYGIPDSLIFGREPVEGTEYERGIRRENKTGVYKEVLDNPGIVREYVTLKFDIVAKVLGLIERVQNGTPLDGYCEACPSRHIKIEE